MAGIRGDNQTIKGQSSAGSIQRAAQSVRTLRRKIRLILLPPRGKRQSAANQAASLALIIRSGNAGAKYASLDGFKARPYA
jgi:hypothetical protein